MTLSKMEIALARIQMTVMRAEREYTATKNPQRKEEILRDALHVIQREAESAVTGKGVPREPATG